MQHPKTVGASAVLHYNGSLVFEIQKTHKWTRDSAGRYRIGVGCIGGSIEPGETPQEALRRECVEEVGAEPDILPHLRPFELFPDGTVADLEVGAGPEGLFFYWYGDLPEYRQNRIAVFRARIADEPRPNDLAGVLVGGFPAIRTVLEHRLSVKDALKSGIKVIRREHIPHDAILVPVGTVNRLIFLSKHFEGRIREAIFS